MQKITELFAWVTTHPNGDEEIPAFDGANGFLLPMISSNKESVESLRATALVQTALRGLPVKLCKFSVMTVLEEHSPSRRSGNA